MQEEFEIYGVDFRTRASRHDEMVEVLRKLWAGGMVEHHGRHFDFPALQISPAPPQTVPVYTGGGSPAALRRAAQLADGWIGAGNTPAEVPGIVAELDRLRTEAGRAQRPFETVIGLSTPPDLATFQRLADAGMDIGMSYPFKYIVGERSSVDEKKRAMDQFAATIIRAFDRRA
jgi:alkanesulfonate monooxygenase SsuD/methylene tetrahydromethanopterin reductase-like flavin-dependent oxidoreductase (luciferase family)